MNRGKRLIAIGLPHAIARHGKRGGITISHGVMAMDVARERVLVSAEQARTRLARIGRGWRVTQRREGEPPCLVITR